MLSSKQVTEVARMLKSATITNCSQIAYQLAVEMGRGTAVLYFQQMLALLDLPAVTPTELVVQFLTVPEGTVIPIVKLLREQLGLSLRDAKGAYDAREIVLPYNRAEPLVQELRKLGVVVQVTPR